MAEITKHDARKQLLVDAAISVFIEKGFKDATMREVAAAAGLTTGALYHHFKNKEDLFYHAVKDAMFFTKQLSQTDEHSNPKSNESMLEEISLRVKERMSKLAEQRLLVLVTGYILSQAGEQLEDLRREYQEKIGKVADMYFYAFGIDNPQYKRQIASILIAALDGMAIQYSIGALDIADDTMRQVLVDFFAQSIPAYLKAHAPCAPSCAQDESALHPR